jgi:peroxiredoxin family protein
MMKFTWILLAFLLAAQAPAVRAQQPPAEHPGNQVDNPATSIGIVVSSNDEETVWNVFRLANYSLSMGDTVTVFLLGKGVEVDDIAVTSARMKEQVDAFRANHGSILACGTCLQSRNKSNPKSCTISTMSELYGIVRRNKIVLTF